MKWVIIILIFAVGIFSVVLQFGKRNVNGIIWTIVGTLALSIMSSFIYDIIKPFLPSSIPNDSVSVMSTINRDVDGNDHDQETEKTAWVENETERVEVETEGTEKDEESMSSTGDTIPVVQETASMMNHMEDITERTSISGRIDEEGQKNSYMFKAEVEGTYRFDTDLSSGGKVQVRISGENDETISSGINAVTTGLEKDKTYIISIEYQNGPCDYTMNIGVPNEITDITGSVCISGSITYQDQIDRYFYTAPTDGVYRFDTNLSSGGKVWVRISGENGNSINSGINGLTINLEAGKRYMLSVEYQNVCEYTINIGVPIAVTDITGNVFISGSITYQDQEDNYLYTAPVSGVYRFDTDLDAGGKVWVRVSGENGNSINSAINGLTIDLEAGKTYVLGIEYQNGPSDYSISIGVPNTMIDITGNTMISGSITYQDQEDRYFYTASASGSHRFETNPDAGGKVWIQISGENGNSINSGINGLTINLEAGKSYILSIEYQNEPCSYEVFIVTP